jgi:hypothetical protein
MNHIVMTLSLDHLLIIIFTTSLLTAIGILALWIACNERALKEPSDEEVDAACRNTCTSFDDLPIDLQNSRRRLARLWLHAWQGRVHTAIKTH